MACVAEIQRRAQEALVNCPVAELRRLEVVFEGVCLEDQSLLISGTVSSFYYKQLAEEVVRPFCEEIELFNVVLVDNQRFLRQPR
jgi:hypothetical protein